MKKVLTNPNNWVQYTSVCVLMMVLFLAYFYLNNPSLGPDTSYYLQVAREIYSGEKIFVDIGSSYTPLSIIVLGIPFLFGNEPPLTSHLLINFIIIGCSSVILFQIVKFFGTDKKLSFLLSIYYLFVNMLLDSKSICIEPLSVFFQLLAFFIFIRYNKSAFAILVSGFFIGMSFLSKQYGLFLLIPLTFDILINSNKKFTKLTALTIGIVIPLLILYIILGSANISVGDYLHSLLGRGISFDSGNGTGTGRTIRSFLIAVTYFMILHFFIFNIFTGKTPFTRSNAWIYLCVACSSLVLIFANYFHYFQYISPYFFILFAITIKYNSNILLEKKILPIAVLLVCLFMVSLQIYRHKNNAAVKIDLCKLVPKGAKVYLDGPDVFYYYSCNFSSIDLKNVSYTFPGYISPERISKFLDAGEYLIISTTKLNTYSFYLKNYRYTTSADGTYVIINK